MEEQLEVDTSLKLFCQNEVYHIILAMWAQGLFPWKKHTLISADKNLLPDSQIHTIVDITVHLHNVLFYTYWQLHRASAGPQEEVTYTEKLLRLETFKLNLTFSVPSYCHYTSGLQQDTNVESSLEADRGSFGALAWLEYLCNPLICPVSWLP